MKSKGKKVFINERGCVFSNGASLREIMIQVFIWVIKKFFVKIFRI